LINWTTLKITTVRPPVHKQTAFKNEKAKQREGEKNYNTFI